MPNSFLHGRSRLPVVFLVFIDLILALGCGELAEYIRFGEHEVHHYRIITIQALLVVMCSFLFGVYESWRGRNIGERFFTTWLAWMASFVMIIAFMVMTKTAGNYSRIWVGTWVVTSMTLALSFRLGLYLALTRIRRKGHNIKEVLVVGSGRNFGRICDEFTQANPLGFKIKTVITHSSQQDTLEKLKHAVESGLHYDECWLCLPLREGSMVQPVMYALRHHTMDIRFMPGMSDLPILNHRTTPIGDYYSLDISCSPMQGHNWIIKRIEDVVIGTIILLGITPVLAAVALAVKLSSPGPVLFKQKRHGADGKPIKVYKFRSMKIHEEKTGTVTQATKGDSRITPVGAFIRRTSLDELPQFINVLQGRMSIVGPRPHALAHNEYYMDLVESYMQRHKIKPGITGLAQVRGFRGETDTLDKMQRRVECDLEYINNWSVWADVKIIFLTVFKGFVNPNAY